MADTENQESEEKTSQLDLFAEKLAEHTEKTDARMEALLEELKASRKASANPQATQPIQPDKIYTRAELKPYVEAGQLTQDQVDDYLVEVKTKQAIKEAEARLASQLKAGVSANTALQKIEKYKAAIPALMDKRSDEFLSAKEAYEELVADGEPENEKTELRALQVTFGRDPSKSKKSEPRETTSERRTVEATGSRGGRSSEKSSSDSSPGGLDPLYKAHVDRMIDKGVYKGWSDPTLKKEIEYHKASQAKKKKAS